MTNDEAIQVLELAVAAWHQVARDHTIQPCNCFREEYGAALMAAFDVPLHGDAEPVE